MKSRKALLLASILSMAQMRHSLGITIQPPLTIVAAAKHDFVQRGDSLWVELQITNTSSQTLSWSESSRLCDYKVQVTRADGAPVLPSAETQKTKCDSPLAAGRNINVTLKPGDVWKDILEIERFVEVDKPGRYYIRVARQAPLAEGAIQVWSNWVGVEVEQATGTVNGTHPLQPTHEKITAGPC